LQELGTELVNGIAELELGLAQHLAGRLAGEEACQATCLLEQGLLEEFKEALGFGFLLGREGKIGHGATPSEGEFPVDGSAFTYVRDFPPTFEMLTRPNRKQGNLLDGGVTHDHDVRLKDVGEFIRRQPSEVV
jgi:hypothetical protein